MGGQRIDPEIIEVQRSGDASHASLRPRAVRSFLFVVIGVLTLLNACFLLQRFSLDNGVINEIGWWFDVNEEGNVPALYSAAGLAAAAVLLYFAAVLHKRADESAIGWFGLSLMFAFLAYDEAFSFHERLTAPIHRSLDTTGLLYFGWFIVYLPLAIVFALVYVRFLWRLPMQTRVWFVVAGSLFLAGAVGFEMLGGAEVEDNQELTGLIALLASIEEFLEMVGVALFIWAVLDHLVSRFAPARFGVQLDRDQSQPILTL